METISCEEAAEMIGIAAQTLRNWRSLGRGPNIVVLSRTLIRYLRADVEAWIQQQRMTPTRQPIRKCRKPDSV